MKLYIAGPFAGQDCVKQGVVFRKGIAELPAESEGLIRMLARYHQVYPDGSPELLAALKRFGQEGMYVGSSLPENSSGPAGEVNPPKQPSPSTPKAAEVGPDAASGSGRARTVPKGDGHEDTRLDIREVIRAGCMKMDPNDAQQWLPGGKPKLAVLFGLTRDDRLTQENVAQNGMLRSQVAQHKSQG